MFDRHIQIKRSPDTVTVTSKTINPPSDASLSMVGEMKKDKESKVIGVIDIGTSEKTGIPKGTIIVSQEQEHKLDTTLTFCFSFDGYYKKYRRKKYRTANFAGMSKQDIFKEYVRAFMDVFWEESIGRMVKGCYKTIRSVYKK